MRSSLTDRLFFECSKYRCIWFKVSKIFCGKNMLRFRSSRPDMAPATLLKKRFWRWCFPVSFLKFLRTSFYKEHLQWLLLLFTISLKEFSTKIKSWKLVQCPLTYTYQVGYIQCFRDPSNTICLWSVNQCMLYVHSRLLEWVLTYYTISVVTEGYWLWVDFKPYFRIIAVVFWCVFAHWETIEFLYLIKFSCILVCFDEFVF